MKSLFSRFLRGAQGLWHQVSDRPTWDPSWPHFVLGRSAGGRPISVLEFGEGEVPMLFVGQIHGNEVGTQKLVLKLAHTLANHHKRWPRLKFFLIPSLNPDGSALAHKRPHYFNYGRIGRFNENGVDLNRNFPVSSFKTHSHWNRGEGYEEREPVFCGEKGGSEPEVALLVRWASVFRPKASFFFHNVASDVNPGHNELSERLGRAFSMHSGYKYYSHDQWIQLEQSGTAQEWFSLNELPYLEIEGSVRWGSDWKRQRHAIEACIDIAHES